MSGRPAVFVDRDGVINAMVFHSDYGTVDSPATPDELVLLPGVETAIASLRAHGYLVVVVTNQPGIAKGRFTQALYDATEEKLRHDLSLAGTAVDATYVCRHHPDATVEEWRTSCGCRKPKPGLLCEAAADLNIDLEASWMIGDGVTDIAAGAAVGARTILTGGRKLYTDDALSESGVWPDYFVRDLPAAAGVILRAEPAAMTEAVDLVQDDVGENYVRRFLAESHSVIDGLDQTQIENTVELLARTRENGGRIFFLGVGGGAGHASHAVNDFRKIAGFEAYAPTDNVSELTARINDDGWATSYAAWLRGSRLCERDLVFVFSVGGGDRDRNISTNLVQAMELAKAIGASICGVIGRDGGHCARVADACIIVPVISDDTITPHTEGFQAVVWHLLVSHPRLLQHEMKWESSQ